MFRRWVITLTLMMHLSVSGFESTGYEARINNVPGLPKPIMADSLLAVLTDLVLESTAVNLHYIEKMLQMKDVLPAESYLMILKHHAGTVDSGNQALLDHCISYALENGLQQYLSSIYVLKTNFFRQEGMYDSAMIYTLKARENVEKYYDVEEEANVLHLLGDLYYNTGLYDNARKYYQMASEIKGNESEWNSWRRRVIRNNLAQIEMKRGNYYLSLGLFQESLTEMGNTQKTRFDSLAVAYIFLMMAENYLQLKDWLKAEVFADTAQTFYKHLHHKKGQFDGFLVKVELAVNEGKAQKAVSLLDSALVYASKAPIGPVERSRLLWLQSNIHELNNEPWQALEKLKKLTVLKDSLNSNLSAARIQQMQSENQFASLNVQYANIKKQRSLYLALFITTAAIVIITVMFLIRIKQKNRKLVALSIHAVKNKNSGGRIDEHGLSWSGLTLQESDSKQASLVMSFMELMSSKKLFLDSSISLQKVAHELGTNRSYLSKAINLELNQGFSATVNSLRIQEAIKLISQRSDVEKISISGLAADTGFNSRTSFIAAFSNHTGMLPSSFLSNYKSLYGASHSKDIS